MTTHTTMERSPRSTVAVAGALVALLGTLVFGSGAPVAFAHGGPGKLAVTAAVRAGDSVTYTLSVTFVKDGHGANEASITATLRDPANRIVGAPRRAKKVKDGLYAAAITVPKGAWTVRFASLRPPASLVVKGDDKTGT